MKNLKKKIGDYGERVAVDFLTRKGYLILQTNFFSRFGEIDIIAQKNKRLYFIEVKTRTTKNFGLPEESLGFFKSKKIYKAVLDYLYKKDINTDNFQTGLISVLIDRVSQKIKIVFWKNI